MRPPIRTQDSDWLRTRERRAIEDLGQATLRSSNHTDCVSTRHILPFGDHHIQQRKLCEDAITGTRNPHLYKLARSDGSIGRQIDFHPENATRGPWVFPGLVGDHGLHEDHHGAYTPKTNGSQHNPAIK